MASLSPQSILQTVFGYNQFRHQQQAIVEHVIDGRDALVLMPTGGGKSLCYQIPALAREGLAIVVSPLIALMQDQVEALQQLGVNAAFLNSSLGAEESSRITRQVIAGEIKLLYVAPERLMVSSFLNMLDEVHQHVGLALFAIDEAHCVSQWGHDFRPEYLQLGQLAEMFPDVPRIALTATADKRTREEIVTRLHLQDAERFLSSFDRPNIFYRIVPRNSRASSCWRSSPSGAVTPASFTACRARRWKRWPRFSPSRASRRCRTTPVCPTICAPITRSASSTRKA